MQLLTVELSQHNKFSASLLCPVFVRTVPGPHLHRRTGMLGKRLLWGLLSALMLLATPAIAQPGLVGSGAAIELTEPGMSQVRRAVLTLGEGYASRRRAQAFSGLISGTAFILLGTLEMADVTDWYQGSDDSILGGTLIGAGVASLGISAYSLTGPTSDAEVLTLEIARRPDVTDRELAEFIADRAFVARRQRFLSGISSIAAGGASILVGALYEPVSDSDNSQTIFLAAGGILVALGVLPFVQKSPEERLSQALQSLDLADVHPAPDRPSLGIAPTIMRADRETYGGVVVSIR